MSSIRERLTGLGMHGLADELDDIIAHASKRRSTPLALVERMLEIEERERARRSLERRSKRSRVGTFRPMSEFDWAWPKSLPRAKVESALALDFMREGKNLILIGAHGLGKTMIAKNVVHQAVQLYGLHSSSPQPTSSSTSADKSPLARSTAGCVTTRASAAASMSSATSATTRQAPNLFFRSSIAATKRSPPSSRRTRASRNGAPSFRAPHAPPPSSIDSSTTPKSSASRGKPTVYAKRSSTARRLCHAPDTRCPKPRQSASGVDLFGREEFRAFS